MSSAQTSALLEALKKESKISIRSGKYEWHLSDKGAAAAMLKTDEFQGRLKVVKINIDDNEATPAKFGVRGIPTLMVFKNGENVATKVGALAKGQLTAFVEASIA